MADADLTLRVADIQAEAKDVIVVELRDGTGRDLPAFTPGSHVELHLSNGMIRHYSLCNDARERDRYRIGVGLARASRGGSLHVHRTLRVGDTVRVRGPRNNFPLASAPTRHEFIAGGIGITPILSMVRACDATQQAWHLTYLVRSRQRAAFLEELRPFGERVTLHADDESGGLLEVPSLIGRLGRDATIYCCGPAPLMDAVAAATKDHPAGQVRFEWFVAKEPVDAGGGAFTVRLARSGQSLTVPPDKTIIDVLEENGIYVTYSCREGICGSCQTHVLSGIPEHRDIVLNEAEKARNDTMMICCSRARSPELELDL